jgi:hypothetical protein
MNRKLNHEMEKFFKLYDWKKILVNCTLPSKVTKILGSWKRNEKSGRHAIIKNYP